MTFGGTWMAGGVYGMKTLGLAAGWITSTYGATLIVLTLRTLYFTS